MKRASALLAILLLLFIPPPSWGRGGGGCLVEGTLVLTPSGPVPIEKLTLGAPVWCMTEGKLQRAGVEALTEVTPEEALEISAAGAKLRVTPEHPLMVGPGEYRVAGHLKAGDVVYLERDGRTLAVRVEATQKFLSERPAFNLLVIPGGTFVAGGFVVHNKGCFLPDSPILRSDGTEVQIGSVQPGDKLLAFTAEGRLVTANVKNIVKHEADEYILLKTDRETIRVTREHPFYVGNGTFRTLEALKPGDTIIAWDGQSLAEQRIVSLERVRERVPVFNLQTDQPNTFFAGRLAVHNKGGGCFPAGTRITASHGTVPIEGLAPGDEILGVTEDGRIARTAVKSLLLARGPTLRIETDGETLVATQEHPVRLWGGGFLPAEELRTGDQIAGWKDGRLRPWTIRGLSKGADEGLVFNLRVDEPHTFLAEAIVVHNKGGGCFPVGTRIITPIGQVPMETLARDDQILTLDENGHTLQAHVERMFLARAWLLKVETDHETVMATGEHPIGLWEGGFREAGKLQPGDRIRQWQDGRLVMATVRGKSSQAEKALVLNLQVSNPHTFIAENTLVHNKGGGCFPEGTLIRTPQGRTAIEKLSPGDPVVALDPEGQFVHARVESVLATQSQVLVIDTDRGTLRTTEEHPMARPDGTFGPAGELRHKERVLVHAKGLLRQARVHGTFLGAHAQKVFNLTVTKPHTFLAEGFVVHNKGGGHSGSRGTSVSDGYHDPYKVLKPIDWIIILLLFVGLPLAIAMFFVFKHWRSKTENLDFVFSKDRVSRKAAKTERLLAFLSQQDPSVSPGDLRKLAESTFLRLQECWEKRDYEPMKPLLMSALFKQHVAQIQGMIRNHEINRIANLVVEQVDLVNVRYTEKADQREFTVLFTASASDYYVDDRNHELLRGDMAPARFQEFWTFHRVKDEWLLREIEQTGESDYLNYENFVEMLTDDTLKGIYQDTAREGVAGPWLSKREGKKADRTERLLNFLVRTDKLWDRRQMLERAREVFLGVYLARESGDPDRVPADYLFPEVAESLRKQMRQWQSDGIRVEYRNLCTRKAELILVRNYADQSKDEFSVRIDAHAQKIVRKGETVFSEQEYVTPFEEFWTFGRRLGQWKLKEVLPPARGKRLVEEENLDEESGPDQLEWYYRQTRAV